MPLEGWAPIIDCLYMRANRDNSGSVFTCPEMADVEGMADGQTGTDPNNPIGASTILYADPDGFFGP